MTDSKVLIVVGSDSDFPVMEPCFNMLKRFGIPFEAHVCSAHRSPDRAAKISSQAKENGFSVIIAAARLAAHLPGVLAAYTTLPVIGVPCKSGALNGADALYSVVQMPSGVPVACVAIDGAANAAILALQILAVHNPKLSEKVVEHKKELELSVQLRQDRLVEKMKSIGE